MGRSYIITAKEYSNGKIGRNPLSLYSAKIAHERTLIERLFMTSLRADGEGDKGFGGCKKMKYTKRQVMPGQDTQ